MASLSTSARADVRARVRDGQGRVVTPEFGHSWRLRPCRDVGHMAWNQVAHYTPWITDEESAVGDAGGGIVKFVGS